MKSSDTAPSATPTAMIAMRLRNENSVCIHLLFIVVYSSVFVSSSGRGVRTVS